MVQRRSLPPGGTSWAGSDRPDLVAKATRQSSKTGTTTSTIATPGVAVCIYNIINNGT
jgi:hypothetical protein